ncbi:BTB/POZ domain-containing protein-like [Dorcoceras hygrometricum]|uniref:BTB/POZ domain-containing protein-like n=1 Tax=Dorcoceras hygrometricum TaxID=472368 RepID=A0A2Z7ACG9_9LAMI|nr:BTB/POZ domain-containing protein-like [Dorcoceras hygrometricum]
MANQIKRRNVSSLTYENFPGGHSSQRLAPTSFTGKLALQRLAVEFSESGPRLESRLLRQSALEDLTNLSQTESPPLSGRNKSDGKTGGGVGRAAERGGRSEGRRLGV